LSSCQLMGAATRSSSVITSSILTSSPDTARRATCTTFAKPLAPRTSPSPCFGRPTRSTAPVGTVRPAAATRMPEPGLVLAAGTRGSGTLPCFASGPVASLVDLATVPGCASSWSSSPSPTAGSAPAPRRLPPRRSGRCHPQRSSSAAGAGPRPPPGCPSTGDSAACSAWSRHTITAKNDGSCSPPTRHRHPEHRPGDLGLGVANLGFVGGVVEAIAQRLRGTG
jgi:hypothetical protein